MTEDTEAMTEDTDAMASGDGLALEGDVEVAAGTVLKLDECPDWDPYTGVTDSEIRVGQTLPQSGQLASFGLIGEGIQMYFDYINETDPVEGKDLVLITKDDGYEAGRAVANVEEMIDTENILGLVHSIGTPVNAAIRPITDENCVPQLFNSSGFPMWGDPAHFPWTIGNILNYATESTIWCNAIVDEFGEGATVAALYMNNDFGKTYQNTINQCAADGKIEVVAEALHDPAAPDVNNEMTTMISSGAQVFLAGTTAAFCPQTVASVAQSEWRPRYFMSYTCNNLAAYFTPVQDQAAALAADGAGVRMVNSNKVCGDPKYADDPAIIEMERILKEYGNVTCADGGYSTGVLYGDMVVRVLRQAAAMPGGVNRVNLMAAMWNFEEESPYLLGGKLHTDGVNDAYTTEAGQVQSVGIDNGSLTFIPEGDFIDTEGQAGSVQG
ncbi:MAG: ABC transporter substrate-binding protein [Ilumatobacteraceae bacterium]